MQRILPLEIDEVPRLILNDVCKCFGGPPAVDSVSLDIPEGAFLALLGPSGCGKTTLLRMIAGLERPDRGEILFDDKVVAGTNSFVPPEQRHLGMVFQSYALWPNMTVKGNIEFGLKVAGLPSRSRSERISEVIEVVGLKGLEGRRPHELSGGQRQRVALARSLAMRPRLILLDEPLANLDAHLREAMLSEFRRIHPMTGATFVFVTHDQDEAMAVASHVAVMNRGRIEQVGTPEELYTRPATKMMARFIGRGRILPVDILASSAGRTVIRLGSTVLEMPGNAAVGAGWLCFHAGDLEAVQQDGHFKAELVGQIFHNGKWLSHCTPVGLDADLVSLPLKHRVSPGETLNLAFTGGWVIGRTAAKLTPAHLRQAEPA